MRRLFLWGEKWGNTGCLTKAVKVRQGDVVYCDIPYSKTEGYGVKFDNNKFYDWADTRDYPVYFSSYKLDDKRFERIAVKNKTVLLCADNKKKATEWLYWNKAAKDTLNVFSLLVE